MLIAQLLTLLPFIPLVPAAADTGVPPDLKQAMRERQQALETADTATWDRLTSAEFTLVNAAGQLLTKTERLAGMKKQGPMTVPSEQEQIRVYENTAVQRVRNGDVWVIQVWVRQPHGWQVVATQLTTVAKK